MLLAVLDTNVLVSSLAFRGETRQILSKALRLEFGMVTSPVLLEELGGVLRGRKFAYPSQVVDAILTELKSAAYLVHPRVAVTRIKQDPADNRVLECALEVGADAIVTGDQHLLQLQSFQGIPILTPRAFLQKLSSP